MATDSAGKLSPLCLDGIATVILRAEDSIRGQYAAHFRKERL